MTATAHIINHTHWDREWFLTSIYTRQWIPGLIDALERLVARNPAFTFFLDGQTLVLEDLAEVAPEYTEKAARLVRNGNLVTGPYYCQPDWQLTNGELLIRNMIYGRQDMEKYGGRSTAGWLVDTFGHISQSPQLHRLFGIEAVYVWRGVPVFEPYFYWQGPDGSRLFTIFLLGGYRNLYGVSHARGIAVKRLALEMEKLLPFYPSPDVPLFDGYDLEDDPEDPLAVYASLGDLPSDLHLQAATPAGFARLIQDKQLPLPVITSELNSGKFGATFPGTLSTRDDLKVMAYDCARLLFHWCEPLAVLGWLKGRTYPTGRYEALGRQLLQNAVHDGICGVSIDQVHEKMEYSYRQAFQAMLDDIQESLASILADFPPGKYAVCTNPMPAQTWQPLGDELFLSRTEGIGVWPVEVHPSRRIAQPQPGPLEWQNEAYQAVLMSDGLVQSGPATMGELRVFREKGDTYSGERGEYLGKFELTSPVMLEQQSSLHCTATFNSRWEAGEEWVSAAVQVQFDPSALIRWQIELDSQGANLRVEMVFDTGQPGECRAGMPFDLVERPVVDRDLFLPEAPERYARIMLGQREVDQVTTFPFQEMLVITGKDWESGVFAKGVHAYSLDEQGEVKLILRRSVEWLTKTGLEQRVGDAGPLFYVPGARSERVVRHELAAVVRRAGSLPDLAALNAAFHNPPLIVYKGHTGATGLPTQHPTHPTFWQVFREKLPISSLHIAGEKALARLYNPHLVEQALDREYVQTNIWGEAQGNISSLKPRQIATVQLETVLAGESIARQLSETEVELLTPPTWRVGEHRSRPSEAVLAALEEKIAVLEKEIGQVATQMHAAVGSQKLLLEHRYYVLKRESVEYQLSLLLNRRKQAQPAVPGWDYLYGLDTEIAALGLELNRLRIKRRIYDYIVQAL